MQAQANSSIAPPLSTTLKTESHDSKITSGSGQIAQKVIGFLIQGTLFVAIKTIELTYFCVKTGINQLRLALFASPATELKHEISHTACQTEKLENTLLSIKEASEKDEGDIPPARFSAIIETCINITTEMQTSIQKQKTYADSLEQQLLSEKKLKEQSQKELDRARASNEKLQEENLKFQTQQKHLMAQILSLRENKAQQEESIAAVKAAQHHARTQRQEQQEIQRLNQQTQTQQQEIQRSNQQKQDLQQRATQLQTNYATLLDKYNALVAEHESTRVLIRGGNSFYMHVRR